MNDLYVREFVTQALQAGLPQEKIAAILDRAESIANQTKTASSSDIVDQLLSQSDLEKSASSVSYVQGLLTEALNSGATLKEAADITKQALAQTTERITFMQKVSHIVNDPVLSNYAEGFIEQAKQAGMNDDEAVNLLVNVIDQEKQANDASLAQMGASGPQAAPQAGPEGAPDEQQILELLQSLPPEEQQEIIQQLLAAIQQGGQGGGQSSPAAPAPAGPQGPV